MRLQRKVQLSGIIFSAAALFFLPPLASVQTNPTTQSLDGQWLTDGYGDLVEFQGDSLRGYEITKLSCIASTTATRKPEPSDANEAVFAGDDGSRFRVSPATSADTRWLHEDGSVSSILLRRAGSRPEPRGQPLTDTPLMNYRVFSTSVTSSCSSACYGRRHIQRCPIQKAADRPMRSGICGFIPSARIPMTAIS